VSDSRAIRPVRIRGVGAAQGTLCAAAVGVSAIWAFWPLGSTEVLRDPAAPEPSSAFPEWKVPELRIAAFSAPLWVAPPAPPPPPEPEPKPAPPAPLKLQLLAVINQDGAYQAVLFDPDSDTIYNVREGESLGARTVERVSASGVDLKDSTGTRTLALQDKEPKR
jgi:hypothetical protein